ncbi:beta-N-acetylhexosaminidase [Bdellovibrio reynosensis]|uniref:Beta-N-acetylhexosaminidase n=1 Tax=Bdellovibrio reynosensis TaxID=2835041 RepID=A0ABY4CA29_9BACT|nr:beta-N-acetylhexosaminidase [Bdellovibrio reynosensis]UOF00536.1 beta-N-acetylhexosaminidase [Bdellovibrio reynosensis]
MSISHIIGQHMFIGLSGHSLTADEKKFIVDNNIGGVCLFGRNVAEPKQVRELCAELQSLRHKQYEKAPLFIGIDMEGGRVHRLKPPFTTWPPLRKLGDLDAPTVSFHFANRMGLEMKAVGINLDFAPCVDIFTNPANTVIGDRSISSDPEMVAKHASALVRGYIKSEIITCAKHFPGHGNTIVDSHEDLPVENVDAERLEACELIPFKKSFKARVDMVMTSHIKFPKIDPDWPVTLSETFIKGIIRNELRYRGLIITDDLGMKAMTSHYGADEVPVRALKAGVDLLLYCNEPDAPPKAFEAILEATAQGSLKKEDLEESYRRILELKKTRITQPDPLSMEEVSAIVGHPDHLKIASAIANGQVPDGLLPE